MFYLGRLQFYCFVSIRRSGKVFLKGNQVYLKLKLSIPIINWPILLITNRIAMVNMFCR
jgi:hypothetical protein